MRRVSVRVGEVGKPRHKIAFARGWRQPFASWRTAAPHQPLRTVATARPVHPSVCSFKGLSPTVAGLIKFNRGKILPRLSFNPKDDEWVDGGEPIHCAFRMCISPARGCNAYTVVRGEKKTTTCNNWNPREFVAFVFTVRRVLRFRKYLEGCSGDDTGTIELSRLYRNCDGLLLYCEGCGVAVHL